MKGISIIICCYNSEWIINKCLEALSKQQISNEIQCEILLIDNCCTDNTAMIAQNYEFKNKIRLRILKEEKPGLRYARMKGISEAQFEYLLFVDDDNLLSEQYIEKTYQLINSDNQIGAIGGCGIPYFWNTEKPFWFDDYSTEYALGTQLDKNGNVRNDYLYGAGCCYRKSALNKLNEKNISFNLVGRCGTALSSGEDAELCKQLVLNGYTLKASDELIFTHVLTKKRLTIEYLEKLYYSFGIAGSTLKVYDYLIKSYSFFKIRFILKYFINSIYLLLSNLINKKNIKNRFMKAYVKGYIYSINNKGMKYYFNLYDSFKSI